MTRSATRPKSGPNTALVVMTAVAIPAALITETIIHGFLPPDFQLLRQEAGPYATMVAWVLVPICLIAGVVAAFAHKPLLGRRLKRLKEDARTEERIRRESTGTFLLTSSIPQVPAIVTSICWLLGSDLLPVLLSTAVVTGAILLLAFRK